MVELVPIFSRRTWKSMEYNLLLLSVTDSLIVYPIATFACFDFGYNSNRLSERLQLSLKCF